MPTTELDAAGEILTRIELDPTYLTRLAWGARMWSGQERMYAAMHDHDRLIVTGGHSVGKTYGGAWFVCEFVATHPGAKVVIVGPTFNQVKTRLWADVRKAYHTSRVPLGGEMKAEEWIIEDGWYARIAGADRPESLQGVHGRNVLVLVDEASGVNARLWPALDSLMASEGAKMIVWCNPTEPDGRTRDMADDPRWKHMVLSCLDHPNVIEGREVIPGAVTKAWVDDKREQLRRGLIDQDYWRARVCGEFATGGENAVVTRSDLEAAADGTRDVADAKRIGLDVSRFGSDQTVLVVMDETRRVVEVEAWTGQDLMATTGRLLRAAKVHGVAANMIGIDVCGMGAGVVDRCRELGHGVTAVDFGAKPAGDWSQVVGRDAEFYNRRSEMHWVARALLRSHAMSIPRERKEIWSDACAARYGYDSAGQRLKVESKDEIKARIGRSPDHWDAVLIALAATRPKLEILWA